MDNIDSCYYYNEVTINKRKSVLIDVAIVLTMDHKTLEDENIKQIIERVPSNRLIIQFNKGFKKCDKKHLIKQQSNYDLCDATETALKYAFDELKLENVLILEDDAFFVDNIEEDLMIVKDFLKRTPFTVYSLGTFGYIANPLNILLGDEKHIKVYKYGGSHACIYNKNFLKSFKSFKCEHIDIYSKNIVNSFVYYKPLVIQYLTNSSLNYESWGTFNHLLYYFFKNICGMFKQYPPEYKDFRRLNYMMSTISLVVLFLVIVIILYGFIIISKLCFGKTMTSKSLLYKHLI